MYEPVLTVDFLSGSSLAKRLLQESQELSVQVIAMHAAGAVFQALLAAIADPLHACTQFVVE